MSVVNTLTRRELGAYFLSPIAYVMMAMFLFLSGLAFGLGTFVGGGESSLRALFLPNPWMLMILVFVLPLLTMRLVSEELRSGTIEALMTAPVTDTQVILGKYFGALAFYAILLLSVFIIFPLILSFYGPIDMALLLCHFLGMLLIGGLYIAVGLFFSVSTKHQLIAALLAIVVLAIITFGSSGLATKLEGSARAVLQHLSVGEHFSTFARGLLGPNAVIFFLTASAAFLFFAVKWLEIRRWR